MFKNCGSCAFKCRSTVKLTGGDLHLTHTTVRQILTNELKMRKIGAKMVQKNLLEG